MRVSVCGLILLVALSSSATLAVRGEVQSFASHPNMPHGIAGDAEVIFVAEPLNARVAVLDAGSGVEIATVPAPNGGFILPFELEVPKKGHLVVLDPGGFPSPVGLPTPRVYDYKYSYNKPHGFKATLTRNVLFTGIPAVFTEDIEVLNDGRYVVSESGLGALWVIGNDGSISPGIVPASPAPQDAIPALGACPFFATVTEVGGVPFELPGAFAPGVGSMASRDGYLYFNGTCSGGIQRVPISVFTDSRPPHERAADIQLVSPRPDPGDFDTLKGLSFNPYDKHDDWIYAADAFHLRVVRIHAMTGERQVVAADPELFNFPVGLEFIRRRGDISLLVTSDQEHRFSALNAALQGVDMFQLPFKVARIPIK